MNRAMILCAAAVALMMPVLALAQPVITNITPTITSANTGTTVDIYGSGFGSLSDIVYFPDYTGGHNVNPIAVISGGVRVRVPDAGLERAHLHVGPALPIVIEVRSYAA